MLLVSLVPRLRPISPASLAGLSPKPPGCTRTRYRYVPNRKSVINVGFNEYVQPNARLVAGQRAASEVEGRRPSRHFPICARRLLSEVGDAVTAEKVMCLRKVVINPAVVLVAIELLGKTRSEERRVGKECR